MYVHNSNKEKLEEVDGMEMLVQHEILDIQYSNQLGEYSIMITTTENVFKLI